MDDHQFYPDEIAEYVAGEGLLPAAAAAAAAAAAPSSACSDRGEWGLRYELGG